MALCHTYVCMSVYTGVQYWRGGQGEGDSSSNSLGRRAWLEVGSEAAVSCNPGEVTRGLWD